MTLQAFPSCIFFLVKTKNVTVKIAKNWGQHKAHFLKHRALSASNTTSMRLKWIVELQQPSLNSLWNEPQLHFIHIHTKKHAGRQKKSKYLLTSKDDAWQNTIFTLGGLRFNVIFLCWPPCFSWHNHRMYNYYSWLAHPKYFYSQRIWRELKIRLMARRSSSFKDLELIA